MLFNQFHIFLPGLALGPVRAYQSVFFIFNHFLYLSYSGSRLSVKSLSTAKPLGLVLALAPVVILNHGPRCICICVGCIWFLFVFVQMFYICLLFKLVFVQIFCVSQSMFPCRSATPLRSGATPDITTTTPAGMETTVLTR